MGSESTRSGHAAGERAALAATLAAIGPGAPTLCEGWASEDLVAHLVVREGRPLASLGNVVRPLSDYTDRVQRRLARANASPDRYASLVETFRAGPPPGPFRIGRMDEALNLVEFFVHHEDARRATAGWQPRELPQDYQVALWRRVRTIARFRPPFGEGRTTLVAPGFADTTVGRGPGSRTMTGGPPELLLWLFGRRSVAGVTISE